LEASGSPFSRWARLRIASCRFHSFQYGPASEILKQTRDLPGADRYPALAGSLDWTLGVIRGIERDPATSLAHYQRSLESFLRAREEMNVANVRSLLSEAFGSLGGARQAWG